jgi:hypothetical protein
MHGMINIKNYKKFFWLALFFHTQMALQTWNKALAAASRNLMQSCSYALASAHLLLYFTLVFLYKVLASELVGCL